jgi:elongation factor Ts
MSIELVKQLRDRTGIAIGACKKALEAAHGDMDKAIESLRKAGLASAIKKQERAAEQGVIVFAQEGHVTAILEVNSETDFVAKNDRFLEFAKNIAEEAAKKAPESLEDFLASPYSKDKNQTVDAYRIEHVQTIGENIQISRLLILKADDARSYGVYSHLGGKMITAVEILGSSAMQPLAEAIAMHVAAAAPEYLNPEKIPAPILEKEKEIIKTQMQGKPADLIDKILGGKIEAFFGDVCLTHQKYIKDESLSIKDLVEQEAKKIHKPLTLNSFIRWTVGQK